jgi:hypothetical protein
MTRRRARSRTRSRNSVLGDRRYGEEAHLLSIAVIARRRPGDPGSPERRRWIAKLCDTGRSAFAEYDGQPAASCERTIHRERPSGPSPFSIDSVFPKLLDVRDGSLSGINRECGAGKPPNAAAAPATVSGESFVIGHWESRSWEGDARYRPASQETCRQPWSHAKMSVGDCRHWLHQTCDGTAVRLGSL